MNNLKNRAYISLFLILLTYLFIYLILERIGLVPIIELNWKYMENKYAANNNWFTPTESLIFALILFIGITIFFTSLIIRDRSEDEHWDEVFRLMKLKHDIWRQLN